MKEHKTLLLVIYNLSAGGAERIMSVMANYWAEKQWNIKLLTIEKDIDDFYPLDARIERINLNMGNEAHSFIDGMKNNFQHIMAMRNVFKQHQPDCIISFLSTTNILSILAATNIKIPVIISERINPVSFPLGQAWEKIRTWVYPHTSSLVVQTADIADWGREFIDPEKVDIIPNPVWINDQHLEYTSDEFKLPDGFLIFAMGRLDKQKGFDTLINAFSQTGLSQQGAHLIILGEGDLRTDLESLVSSLGLEEKVHLPGQIYQPHALIKEADIFVLSSRFEGFPNALIEAMALGCAVISTDCPSGPSIIIEDGINGLLTPVDDTDLLAEKISSLHQQPDKRKQLKANALTIRETYSLEKIMGLWESVIEKVIQKNR